MALWNQNLSTGIEGIDTEHQKLFQIMNRFGEACDDGVGSSLVIEILDELIDYTVSHFNNEERQLEKKNYALLDKHKKVHQDLKNEVLAYRKEAMGCDDLNSLGDDIVVFLEEWLISHIMKMDIPAFRD